MAAEPPHATRGTDSSARLSDFRRLDPSEPLPARLPTMEQLEALNSSVEPACLQEPPLAVEVIEREWPAAFLPLSSAGR